MLAPTRLRLINVGVIRPRFPDLVIDMRSNGRPDDVVIMLRNGGGKTTLNSMWFFLYDPDRSRFLARVAQRHQGKQGKTKQFDHYVPAGSTAYVICEHEIASAATDLFGQTKRLLVGYAASKPANATSDDKASIGYFLLESTAALTLDTLPLRDTQGHLVGAETFFQALEDAKQADPALQLTLTKSAPSWRTELIDRGFDLDFMRQFLFRMNLDEGAADRVFTYDTPRAFINSLADVLTTDTQIENITNSRQRMRDKLAGRDADEATLRFLKSARQLTEPLAISAQQLREARRTRRLIASRAIHLTSQLEKAEKALGRAMTLCDQHVQRQRGLADTAQRQHRHLTAQRSLLTAHQRRLELDQARAQHATAIDAAQQAHRAVQVISTAILVHLREQAINNKRQMLREKQTLTSKAEPTRTEIRTLAALLVARYEKISARLSQQSSELGQAVATSKADREKTSLAQVRAAEQKQAAGKDLEHLEQHRDTADDLRRSLIADGVLAQNEPASVATQRYQQAIEDQERQAISLRETADILDLQAAEAEAGADRLRSEARPVAEQQARQQAQYDGLKVRTERLAEALVASGYADADTIDLDEHADILTALLEKITTEVRAETRTYSEQAARLGRDVNELDSAGLLPARADVVSLVSAMRSQNLPVKTGWAWLSEADENGADSAALAKLAPEAADGIIVSVDTDFGSVVEWLDSHLVPDELQGPITIATSDIFTSPDRGDQQMAYLPHAARWSKAAAADALPAIRGRQERILERLRDADVKLTLIQQLRGELLRWTEDIGPQTLYRLWQSIDSLNTQLEQINTHVAESVLQTQSHRAEAAQQRSTALDKDRQAHALALDLGTLEPLANYEAGAHERDLQTTNAQRRLRDAERRFAECTARLAEIQESDDQHGALRAKLASEAALHQRRSTELTALANTYTYPDDQSLEAAHLNDTPQHALSDDVLTESLARLVNRYLGMVTDEALQAKISAADDEVDKLVRQIGAADSQTTDEATALAGKHTVEGSSFWTDMRTQAEAHRQQVDKASGRYEQLVKEAETKLNEASVVVNRLGTATLDDTWLTEDTERLQAHLDDINSQIGHHVSAAKVATEHAEVAIVQSTRLGQRQTQLLAMRSDTNAAVSTLTASGPLGEHLDLTDLSFDPDPDDNTRQFTNDIVSAEVLLGDYEAAIENGVKHAKLPGLDRLTDTYVDGICLNATSNLQNLERRYRQTEFHTHQLIEGIRACCATAPAAASGRVVDNFKTATAEEWILKADKNDHDAAERIAAIEGDLARYEKELETVIELIHSDIDDIRSRVKLTARMSVLPHATSLGAWAGQPYLKINWTDGGRTARLVQLRAAFLDLIGKEPEGKRNSNETPIHRLLEAITPQLKVEILIPKVPLDPAYHPIDELALRTSGGEGVTAAVIIAALMLAMRRRATNQRACLVMDNPFSKVSEPLLLHLMRTVANSLGVQLVFLTPSRDEHALSVFSTWVQLKVDDAHAVIPGAMDDADGQEQLRSGPLIANGEAPTEWNVSSASVGVSDPTLGRIPTQYKPEDADQFQESDEL